MLGRAALGGGLKDRVVVGGGGVYGAFQQCYAIRRCRLSPPHKNNLVKILSGATFTYHLTMQLVTFLWVVIQKLLRTLSLILLQLNGDYNYVSLIEILWTDVSGTLYKNTQE